MKHEHVTGHKRERKDASDWYRKIAEENIRRIEAKWRAKQTLSECNGRVDKAVALALNGDVELLPSYPRTWERDSIQLCGYLNTTTTRNTGSAFLQFLYESRAKHMASMRRVALQGCARVLRGSAGRGGKGNGRRDGRPHGRSSHAEGGEPPHRLYWSRGCPA